jgi:hypothetical protein
MSTRVGLVSFAVVVVLVAALTATASADDGFRCKSGRLVLVGMKALEVSDRCGDPDAISSRLEKRRIKHRYTRWVGGVQESVVEEDEVEVPVDEWTYDLGPGAFVRYVLFEGGAVTDVTTGGYGRK